MEQQTTIPVGLCQCGCNQKTKPYRRTRPHLGYVKGCAKKYLLGHHCRNGGRTVTSEGYVYVKAYGHPHATKSGYVLEHRLMAEQSLGHYLTGDAVVHHVNCNTGDNRPENLVICENTAYHELIERRARALHACGNADWRKCYICKSWSDSGAMYVHKGNGHWTIHHRSCHAKSEYNRIKGKVA